MPWSAVMPFLVVLSCLTMESYGSRVYTSFRPDHGKSALGSFLLANRVLTKPRSKIRSGPSQKPDVLSRLIKKPRETLIDRLLDETIVVDTPVNMPVINPDKLYDPLAAMKAREEQEKKNQYTLNLGYAIDNLNSDIPNILDEDPNWEIFTEDLELDLQAADAVAFRLVGGVAGLPGRKAEGLQRNQQALERLQSFRKTWVDKVDIRIKTRASTYSLTRSQNGEDVVEVRWNAKLLMKPDMDLIPKWASASIKFFRKHAMGVPDEMFQQREFIVDGVSKFYFDSEGKIFRHVMTDLELLPPLNMLEVDDILWLIGVPSYQPALAYIDEVAL